MASEVQVACMNEQLGWSGGAIGMGGKFAGWDIHFDNPLVGSVGGDRVGDGWKRTGSVIGFGSVGFSGSNILVLTEQGLVMKMSELYINNRILEYWLIYEKEALHKNDRDDYLERQEEDRNRIILFSRTRALFLVDSSECFGR